MQRMETYKLTRCLWALSIFAASTHCASCQTTASIQTRQTVLELRAQERNPQLLSLGIDKGIGWRNDAPEKLIDSVTIEGRSLPVHWKFNRNASRADSRRVAFVYDCASPKLQLTWEWKAPASTGPIEHAIHIQNLGASEIWIPMQDSFQFALPIDPKVALEHFYVEKGAGKPSQSELIGPFCLLVITGTVHPAPTLIRLRVSRERSFLFLPSRRLAVQGVAGMSGIEFSGRTRLTVDRDATGLHGAVGLNPDPGPFRSRLRPR